jgi:hypothetical protein
LAQIPTVLAFSFVEKYQYVIKTNRDSVFISCEAYIPDRLYIIVMYLKFHGFKKNQILTQNPMVLAFSFAKKMSICDEN